MDYLINQHIVFNAAEGSLSVKDDNAHQIMLSASCRRVLLQLIDNVGNVVERDLFFSRYKTQLPEISSNSNLNHCISLLRRYFRELSEHPDIIKTMPRVGFILNAEIAFSDEPDEGRVVSCDKTTLSNAEKQTVISIRQSIVVVLLVAIFVFSLFCAFFAKGSRYSAVYFLSDEQGCQLYTVVPISEGEKKAQRNAALNIISQQQLLCQNNVKFIYYQQSLGEMDKNTPPLQFIARCDSDLFNGRTHCTNYRNMDLRQ